MKFIDFCAESTGARAVCRRASTLGLQRELHKTGSASYEALGGAVRANPNASRSSYPMRCFESLVKHSKIIRFINPPSNMMCRTGARGETPVFKLRVLALREPRSNGAFLSKELSESIPALTAGAPGHSLRCIRSRLRLWRPQN
eukprot:IDg4780t1